MEYTVSVSLIVNIILEVISVVDAGAVMIALVSVGSTSKLDDSQLGPGGKVLVPQFVMNWGTRVVARRKISD